jgi:hypothetical protein
MGAITGKEGLVEYKGVPVFRIQNWTATVNTDIRDHTSFSTGTLQWREVAPGLSGANGSFSGFWDSEGSTAQNDCMVAALAASTGSVKLYGDKGQNSTSAGALTGNIFFSGMTVGSAVDGDATVDFPFTFNGAVSYSTTT